MKTMLDTFLDELTRGLYAQTDKGTYAPTLVIGLGGTGLKVLRHLKKALNRHQTQEIRLLGIETDDSENNKFPSIPPLDPNELVVLDAEAAIRTLARAEDGDPAAQHVLEYLPATHDLIGAVHQSVRGKIQLRKGAGQLRRAGKLLFCSNVADGVNLENTFLNLRSELTGLGTMLAKRTAGIDIERGTRVFVVCSLAGGTGAGCLIDVLGLVRKHFGGATDVVTAVCLLPGKALDKELTDPRDEKVNTRGNTIGVLRELQAFMLGQLGSYTFQFDAHTELDLGNKNLVNCAYLIGDTQWNGTPVERWLDLCQAASYFLYGTLGTGVGAAKEAGAVNHDVSDQARMKARPSLYNTVGVGVVEYPIDEIGAFAFRSVVCDLLDRWLDPSVDKSEVTTQTSQVQADLGIRDLEDLQAAFDFRATSLPEARYLKSPSARKKAMWKDDDWFVGKAEAVVGEIDGQLAGYDGDLSRRALQLTQAFEDKLDKHARTLMTTNQPLAIAVIQGVEAQIKKLAKSASKAYEKRATETDKVLGRIEELKSAVHKLDLGLDILFRKRQGLIEAVNRYLDLRVAARLEEHVASLLNQYGHAVRDLLNRMQSVTSELQIIHRTNREQMEALVGGQAAPGFVQHAMPLDKIPAWVKSLKLPVKTGFTATELSLAALIRQALEDVETMIRSGLSALNVQGDAGRQSTYTPRLKGKLNALEHTSVPLIHLVERAPSESDLQPQNFVVAEKAEDLAASFKVPAGGKLNRVDIPNPHFAMCMRTLHEFAVEDWSEYELALKHYETKPWYYHVLPDHVTLPPR